ncbi:MAG TPA: plastocyanin/azurin family copper-binding protein [Gemmatimonadaceae bacterium]
MHRFVFAAVLAAAVSLAACGGDGASSVDPVPTPGPVVTSAVVQATPANQFTPGTINLAVGGSVEFDFGPVAHDVFFDGAPSGAPSNITAPSFNTSVSRTFTAKGRYVYNCHIHPGMSGVVVVQ